MRERHCLQPRFEELQSRVTPSYGMPVLATVAASGAATGNAASFASEKGLSGNGRFLVFESAASNLDASVVDGNGQLDIYRRDLVAGTTQLVSVRTNGTAGNGASTSAAISDDGRYVAFVSNSTNLTANATNGRTHIFVRDMQVGTTICVSVNGSGAQGNGDSILPRLSDNGRRVAFQSSATNLTTGDGNAAPDVFLHDLDSASTLLVSRTISGQSGNGASGGFGQYRIAGSGDAVVFVSSATDLVPGVTDANGVSDIFLRSLSTATTQAISVDVTGIATGNGASSEPSISNDGNRIAFASIANNLGPSDGNGVADLYVRNVGLGTTLAASVRADGLATAALGATSGFLAASGNRAFFVSASTDIGSSTAASAQIYARDLMLGQTLLATVHSSGSDGTSSSGYSIGDWGLADDAGDLLVFESDAADLTAGDGNGLRDVFVRDLRGATTTLLSRPSVGAADGISTLPTMSADGGRIAFNSLALALAAVPDSNGGDDVYVVATAATAPALAGLWFDGSAWTPNFRAAAGDESRGYPAQTGGGQLASMPWKNVDRIRIQFTEHVLVEDADLAVRGVAVANYVATAFDYDAISFVATWTFAAFGTDRLLLDLDGDSATAVCNSLGVKLAGAWQESVDVFPSSGAAATDFRFRFNVQVGNVDRSVGPVSNADLNAIRNRLFSNAGDADFDIFRDVDGSGGVRNADLNAVRDALFSDLPAGSPLGPNRAREPNASPRRDFARRLVGPFRVAAARDAMHTWFV